MSWKLSPSDLTFLWDECKRCFYLKVVHGLARPSTPMPKIFIQIDKLMKGFFEGKSTRDICWGLPDGIVKFGEKWVTSQEITFPSHTTACYLRGKFDSLVQFADGSYGVVDFKTSETKPEHIAFYSRQLHAYAYALENPAPNSLFLSPITRLGLFCVEPVSVERTVKGQIAYLGNASWLECPRDDAWFLSFLEDVVAVLEQSSPPASNPDCAWCPYREAK